MKKFILLYLILFGAFVVKAQNTAPKMPTPDEIAKKNVDELDKRLKLNATQKSVIYSYAYNQAKEQAEMIKRRQAGKGGEQDVDNYYKLSNETDKNIRNVLKGEQQTEYDKIVEERLSGKSGKKKKKGKGDEEISTGDLKGLLSAPALEKQGQ